MAFYPKWLKSILAFTNPEQQKAGIIATAKLVLDISDQEISEMSDELMELYPVGYAVFYEECIHCMQNRMKKME